MTKIKMKTFSPELKFTAKNYQDLEKVAKRKGISKTVLVFGYVLDGLSQE